MKSRVSVPSRGAPNLLKSSGFPQSYPAEHSGQTVRIDPQTLRAGVRRSAGWKTPKPSRTGRTLPGRRCRGLGGDRNLFIRRIYNVCYRFAGAAEDAEDLTQEVFIKMYRTLKSYDVSKGAFITWVTTIARNLLVDHFRAKNTTA